MTSPPSTPPPPYEELPPQTHYSSTSPTWISASVPEPTPESPQSQPPPPSQSSIPSLPPRKPVPTKASPSPNLASSNAEIYNDWKFAPDPRSSSSQSLLPTDPHGYTPSPSLSSTSTPDPLGRRTLLVIYIHGFLGNDESFRSFPAHVHALLTNMLAESHVIHSKIYPRYKTYRALDVARDNFSVWLAPHESPTTDVILVGHSMGGILAADVVLMPNLSPYGQTPFKHRILGHISLDCPFLGLHPGIVVSGISSLFKPAPQPHDPVLEDRSSHNNGLSDGPVTSPGPYTTNLTASQPSALGPPTLSLPTLESSSSLPSSSSSTPSDPYFNPPFFNDAAFREQPFVRRALHFASKYRSENLLSAAARHAMSYLEYGGVLADLGGLDERYRRLRALEDVDELQPAEPGQGAQATTTRVRFVNYYTICTGLPKPPKPPSPSAAEAPGGEEKREESDSLTAGKRSPETETLTDVETTERTLAEPKSLLNEKDKISTAKQSPRPSITIEDHDDESSKPPTNNSIDLLTTSNTKTSDQSSDSTTGDATSPIFDLNRLSLQEMDPTPIEEEESSDFQDAATLNSHSVSSQDFELGLLPIPDEPTPPELPDVEQYTDKDARKQAEREVKRLQRAYDQAVKDRTKAIHERNKIIEKRRKKAAKDAEKLEKDSRKEARKETEKEEKEARKEVERLEKQARKQAERAEKEARKEAERNEKEALKEHRRLEKEAQRLEKELYRNQSASPTGLNTLTPSSSSTTASEATDSKPRKLRQFCNLPAPALTATGSYERDHTWVEIFMADVDEVGAHCGLFVPGPHYERLVGDVGSRVLGWVHEDMTKRAILTMGG